MSEIIFKDKHGHLFMLDFRGDKTYPEVSIANQVYELQKKVEELWEKVAEGWMCFDCNEQLSTKWNSYCQDCIDKHDKEDEPYGSEYKTDPDSEHDDPNED